MSCPAIFLDHEEATCELEAGHPGEHRGKFKWQYPSGEWAKVEMVWKSAEDLEATRQ
jgi:hypothetical protein